MAENILLHNAAMPALQLLRFGGAAGVGIDAARKDFKVGFRISSQVVVGHATLIHSRSGRSRADPGADPRAAVREAARVLVPGGLFLLSDTVAPEDPARDTFLNCFELLRDSSHVRDHRVSEWFGMFQAEGFAPELLGTWTIRQEFESWVARIATPADAVTGLRALFEHAPDEVRGAFGIRGGGDCDFTLDLALIAGRAPVAP
jgi:SAM-dependent methyltransferase